jgi:agmatine deiminase
MNAPASTPASDGFRMPAEWTPHARCWMAWPMRPETFRGAIEPAKRAYAEVACAISQFEPVTILCQQSDVAEASLACKGVEVVALPISDSWLRDTGPSFVTDEMGRTAGVHWRFNAWGLLYPEHQEDIEIGAKLLEHLGLPAYRAPLVMEGGAFHVDGEGTLLTTEQCLLRGNRNPDLTRDEIEAHLRSHLGAETVIWLGDGYDGDETAGHIDEIACFLAPGKVLMGIADSTSDPNYAICQDNLARLAAARDAQGRQLEIVTVPIPARREEEGRRLTLSYTNFYRANGALIVPSFEDAADDEAYRILRRALPGLELVPVPALDIVRGGGGIHCITQQQPAAATP